MSYLGAISALRIVAAKFLEFSFGGEATEGKQPQGLLLRRAALYVLLACAMLALPVKTFSQSCATPPATALWFYGSSINVYGATASATCTAAVGRSYVSSGLTVTVVADPVSPGSEEDPSRGGVAGCQTYLTWPGLAEIL